jgi:hypothetical protein
MKLLSFQDRYFDTELLPRHNADEMDTLLEDFLDPVVNQGWHTVIFESVYLCVAYSREGRVCRDVVDWQKPLLLFLPQ